MNTYRGRYGHRFPAIGFHDLARFARMQRFGPQRSFYWNNYPNPIYWPNDNYFMVPGPYGYQQMGINDMLIGGGNGQMWPMGMNAFQAHFEMDND